MLIVEDLTYTDLMEALSVAENQLGRSINPTINSKQEMYERIKQKHSFITRVLSQNMLWLKGESQWKSQPHE